jgi:hypothetical protein
VDCIVCPDLYFLLCGLFAGGPSWIPKHLPTETLDFLAKQSIPGSGTQKFESDSSQKEKEYKLF